MGMWPFLRNLQGNLVWFESKMSGRKLYNSLNRFFSKIQTEIDAPQNVNDNLALLDTA